MPMVVNICSPDSYTSKEPLPLRIRTEATAKCEEIHCIKSSVLFSLFNQRPRYNSIMSRHLVCSIQKVNLMSALYIHHRDEDKVLVTKKSAYVGL